MRAELPAALALSAAFGWLWGSFLNQLVDRAPRRESPRAAAGAAPGPPAGVTPWRPLRSLCFACGRTIPWFDNVPVLSYLALSGRCRACGAPIGRRTLLLELATPALFVAWHGAVQLAGAAGWPVPSGAALAWGFAALSWLLVVGTRRAEGRRVGAAWRVGGVLLLVAVLLGAGAVLLGSAAS